MLKAYTFGYTFISSLALRINDNQYEDQVVRFYSETAVTILKLLLRNFYLNF